MIGDFIKEILSAIFSLIMLPIYLGFFAGLGVFIFLSFKKDFEIQNIVFTQAYDEKYKFKEPLLKDHYESWYRKKIKSGEIK